MQVSETRTYWFGKDPEVMRNTVAFLPPNFEIVSFFAVNKRCFILTFSDFKIKTQKPVRYIHFLHISKNIVSLSIKSQGLCKMKKEYLFEQIQKILLEREIVKKQALLLLGKLR